MFIKTTFLLRKLKDIGKQKDRILISKSIAENIKACTVNKHEATRLYEVKLVKPRKPIFTN